ncbi:MAG: M2 family metallopeptidase [Acidobacteriota bacterium]
MRHLHAGLVPVALLLIVGCGASEPTVEEIQAETQAFLDGYTEQFLGLYYDLSQAEWAANTRIVEGETEAIEAQKAAHGAFAAYTGSVEVIEQVRGFLEKRDQLQPLQVRQLEAMLYRAANNPQTVPELVERRIAAEAAQTEKLYGFRYTLDGREVSTNDLDDFLVNETRLGKRKRAWEASKAVGAELKDGLVDLVALRNGTVQALGYDDYFHYQVSEYGMEVDEMMALNRRFIEEVWPLYRELHTWARHELATALNAPVPNDLPAHWLPNRWGQDWTAMVTVEGIDLDAKLEGYDAEWIVKQAEDFYVSLGLDALPSVFWEKSSLYPLAAGAPYKKNNHASAWHLDLETDVRTLMSVQPNQRWWSTTHHELGHIYYYLAYTRPEVPPLLRGGANRGFHEAVGSLLGVASMQKPFLVARGLVDPGVETDEIQALLQEALDAIVFIPFASGTMTHFEHDLYRSGLSESEYNARWWEYVRKFQGIVPVGGRSEEFCDAATKTHINDDAAQYYDYAISNVLLHQLHRHIATKILNENPRATNYYGREDVGAFLGGILELGATQDWREVMQEHLGEELSAAAMLEYFEPLQAWLVEQNRGREYRLPPKPRF